jgi:hypothetical protein
MSGYSFPITARAGAKSARGILFEKFMDRYFPYTPPGPGKIDNAKSDAAAIAGLYKVSRRFEVLPNADGTISIEPLKGPNGELRRWEEIQPFLYREVQGEDLVVFKKDADGNWQFQVELPVFIFQKVGLFENKYLNYVVLIFGLGVILLTVLLWPVGALIRKHYGRPLQLTSSESRQRLLVRLVCVLFVVLLLGWVAVLSMANDINGLNSLPRWVIIFGLLGVLCSIGAIYVVFNAFRSWRTSGRWI